MNATHPWQFLKDVPSVLKIPILLVGIGCLSVGAIQWKKAAALAAFPISAASASSSNHSTQALPSSAALLEAQRIEGTPDSHLQAFFGDEMFARGDFSAAAERFSEAISQNPTFELLHLKLGLSQLKLNQIDQAIASFQEALYIAPDYPDAHFELASALLKKNQFADAAAHFNEVTTLQPNHPTAYNFLGVALARQGRFNAAHAALIKAVRSRPLYPEARFNLAQVYLKRGAYVNAARELDQALRINPAFDLARLERAKLPVSAPIQAPPPQSMFAAAQQSARSN